MRTRAHLGGHLDPAALTLTAFLTRALALALALALTPALSLAPQVGISIKLLSDAKMLNSMAGQTTLTAAFIDDVFSLVLLVLLASLSEGQA